MRVHSVNWILILLFEKCVLCAAIVHSMAVLPFDDDENQSVCVYRLSFVFLGFAIDKHEISVRFATEHF